MALRYLLDTDTCIYAINRVPSVRARLEAAGDDAAMSSITLGELTFGAQRSQRVAQNIQAVHAFQLLVPPLPFDNEAALHFGEIKSHLLKAGTPCGPYDMLIGAHARSLDLTLVTNNQREFERMPGLRVENWAV